MPELPEVETTVQGIKPHIEQHLVKQVIIRNHRLRWPVSDTLGTKLAGQTIKTIIRRAKYLIFECESGFMIIHLGMSGHLQILDYPAPAGKHDHADFIFSTNQILRYTDPRRFGAILWSDLANINQHPLLSHLGPEPLSGDFTASYFHQKIHNKRCSIKTCIMDSKLVVGIGNIYANEALFLSGIHPQLPACKLGMEHISTLVHAIKAVLQKAIAAGGTTLKDFRKSDGKPGYFSQQLHIYGKKDQACPRCQTAIIQIRQSQRASYFCPSCQPILTHGSKTQGQIL